MLKELDPEFQKSLKFAASDYRNGEACQYTEVPTGVANQKGLQAIKQCETNGHNSETGVSICHCQFSQNCCHIHRVIRRYSPLFLVNNPAFSIIFPGFLKAL